MKFIKSKKGLVLLATLVVAAAAAFGAYAYWTAGGSGSGSAATGTSHNITVNQTSSISGLYPGASVPLAGDFTNTQNSGSVFITSVSASVTGTSAGNACSASNFSITGSAPVGAEVPNGTHVGSWSGLTLNFIDDPNNSQDGCQNATVNISYTAQ